MLLPGRAQLRQFVVVKAFQKTPQCRHFGQIITQRPPQHGILIEQGKVFRTVSAHRLQQKGGFDELRFVKAALTALKRQIGRNEFRAFERAEGAGNDQRPGVRGCRFGQRPGIQKEPGFGEQGQARWHGYV